MKFSLYEMAFGLALLTGQADAFWRMECRGRSALARIDPLVNPGADANHLHTVAGGSGFSKVSTSSELMNSDCTSCAVTQDKSAYWTPPLYFKSAADGQYTLVNQVGGMLAYYFLNYSPGQEGEITAFPKGFSMIAGETKLRHKTDTLEAKALGFNCMNYAAGVQPENTLARHEMPSKEFLDANCKDGIRAELMFPSCWDGKALTGGPSNKAHVAYPDGVMTGSCPPEFPIRLPGLMFETIWDTGAFTGMDGEFVWSNGDATGYGYHGDFITGWDSSVLQAAVDTCTNMSGRIEDCPIFDIQPRATSEQCFVESGAFSKNGQYAGPLKELPGSSPYSKGPEDAKAMVKPVEVKPAEKAASPAAVAKVAEVKPAPVVESPKAPAPEAEAGVFAEQKQEPAPTPAPVAAPVALDDNQKISTTLYKTIGDNEVVEVLVIEEVVTVTEDVVTMTEYKTVNAYQAKHKRQHGHARRHAHKN